MINPPDGAWGKPDANGTWSGLIGHALYGLSNWSMSGIATTPQREEAIDFSYHFVLEYIDWVTPLPKPNPKWPAIFKPFQVETWAATIMVASASNSKISTYTILHAEIANALFLKSYPARSSPLSSTSPGTTPSQTSTACPDPPST